MSDDGSTSRHDRARRGDPLPPTPPARIRVDLSAPPPPPTPPARIRVDLPAPPPPPPPDAASAVQPQRASPNATRRGSSGAIAAVLFTVLGAVALIFGFGVAISRAIGPVTPPGPTTAQLRVQWDENEDLNSSGGRTSTSSVEFVRDGYLAIPVSWSDLCFDSIGSNAGWPPEFGNRLEGGLTSYSIDVTLSYGTGATRFARAAYIARVGWTGKLYVLVPEDSATSGISSFGDASLFPASARGVVDLAKSE